MMFDVEFREVLFVILIFIFIVFALVYHLYFDDGSAFAKPEILKKSIQENKELRALIDARTSPITNDELATEIRKIRNKRYFDEVLRTQKTTT